MIPGTTGPRQQWTCLFKYLPRYRILLLFARLLNTTTTRPSKRVVCALPVEIKCTPRSSFLAQRHDLYLRSSRLKIAINIHRGNRTRQEMSIQMIAPRPTGYKFWLVPVASRNIIETINHSPSIFLSSSLSPPNPQFKERMMMATAILQVWYGDLTPHISVIILLLDPNNGLFPPTQMVWEF